MLIDLLKDLLKTLENEPEPKVRKGGATDNNNNNTKFNALLCPVWVVSNFLGTLELRIVR